MHTKVELPKAFFVREEHAFFPIQHLLTRRVRADIVGDDQSHHHPREGGPALPHAQGSQHLPQLLAHLRTDEQKLKHQILQRSQLGKHGSG
jgi:hypothetical protein